jgi:hypothetical protein
MTKITNPLDRPHFVTAEINDRLFDMLDSGASVTAVADTLSFEYPELSGRETGLAAMWAKETYGKVTQ